MRMIENFHCVGTQLNVTPTPSLFNGRDKFDLLTFQTTVPKNRLFQLTQILTKRIITFFSQEILNYLTRIKNLVDRRIRRSEILNIECSI